MLLRMICVAPCMWPAVMCCRDLPLQPIFIVWNVPWRVLDDAVQGIHQYFVEHHRDTRFIYFDGCRGFGASAVLRAVADALISCGAYPELHFDKVIQIDCSIWKSRRAMQRAIAVELKLDASTMAFFDKADDEDDFNGVDEGSRGEIMSVAEVIDRALRDHKFMIFFHNGSGDGIDLGSFGLPPYRGYKMLWTFRRRFRAREHYSDIRSKVKNAHLFAYESAYDITRKELFFTVLEREAIDIAAKYSCMRDINPERIVHCCLYGLFLHLCLPKHTEYDWAARASNYWMCDGIIQGDRAWEISSALSEEIKWDLHPTLLREVRQRLLEELPSDSSISFQIFKDKNIDGQQSYPWIAITASRNLETQDMQAINAEASSYFLAPAGSSVPIALADGLFNQSTNLHVLHLSYCAFSFASPPFICCRNLKFLGLDHCEDSATSQSNDQRKWQFLLGLWVLELIYTGWYQVLSKEMTYILINLRELSIVGLRYWHYISQLQGQLSNLQRLRIVKPTDQHKTSTDIDDSFMDMTKLEILDLSGNTNMENIPNSLSKASSLQMLVLDGCDGLENVVSPDGLPPSLSSFSFDGYGPLSQWASTTNLPPKILRTSFFCR